MFKENILFHIYNSKQLVILDKVNFPKTNFFCKTSDQFPPLLDIDHSFSRFLITMATKVPHHFIFGQIPDTETIINVRIEQIILLRENNNRLNKRLFPSYELNFFIFVWEKISKRRFFGWFWMISKLLGFKWENDRIISK